MVAKNELEKIYTNKFLLLSILFLAIGSSYFILGYHRIDMNLYFYCKRSEFFNIFFLSATKLAEFYATAIIIIVLFYYRNSYALFYILLTILVTLLVYVFKHHIFGYVRPSLYLKDHLEIQAVAGAPLLQNYSFPSGHTTFIFAGMCYLSLLVKSHFYQIVFFVLALLCGLSRIYLFQHFYVDVYVGSILGICITLLLYFILHEKLLQSTNPYLSFSLKKYREEK
jgi:membrane-associated phospholipid phosphatase